MSVKGKTDVNGSCPCGHLHFLLQWPGQCEDIPVRRCGCTFCRKHGGAWTSNPGAILKATIDDQSITSNYRFGTATADFYVCSRCGVVPFVLSEIDNQLFAVVNVNTFEGIDVASLSASASDFDGEDRSGRLERRRKNWISDVRMSGAAA